MKKLTLSLALLMLGVILSCTELFAAPPSTQARYIFMQSISSSGATAKWLYNGNGDKRIVVIRADNNWGPTQTALSSTTSEFSDVNGNYATAPEIGGTNSYVVDVHSGNTKEIAITGLAAGTTYWIRIFDYNVNGTAEYAVASQGYNNPRSFVTLIVVPSPPTGLSADAGSCFFDINWSLGTNSTGTIMSLFYDGSDSDVCDAEPLGELGTFSTTEGDTVDTDWIDIDLGDLTSIEGFPIDDFNHDHLVRMWGYNGNVGNISPTFTDLLVTPELDCDGPVPTISVERYYWDEETEKWVLETEVSILDDDCVAGERFRVTIVWDESVIGFDEDDVSVTGASIVEDTWIEDSEGTTFYFDISIAGSNADVTIDITGGAEDCAGNLFGLGSEPFTFSVDNTAPSFEDGPDYIEEPDFCVTTNNWDDNEGWGNSPADVEITIGFDYYDDGCCAFEEIEIVARVQSWDPETEEWVNFGEPLSISDEGSYDAEVTFEVTEDTPDGSYRFYVSLTDCLDNENIWYGLDFEVDQTPPAISHVSCTTEVIEGDDEEPTYLTECEPVDEWNAPCLSVGQTVEFCFAIVEDGCSEFNTEGPAMLQGDNGLRLVFNPPLNSEGALQLSSLTGTGTSEDPYIFCFEYEANIADLEGEYSLDVQAADAAGNYNNNSIGHIFTLDFTDPTFNSGEDEIATCYGDGEEIDFCFTAADVAGCGIESLTVILNFADETSVELEFDETEGFYCFDYIVDSETTPEGPATLVITIIDVAGNKTTQSYETEFDFTAPSLVGEPELPENTCLADGGEYCVTLVLEETGCGIDWETASAGYWSEIGDWNMSEEPIYDEELGGWVVTVCYVISDQDSGWYNFYFEVSDVVGNEYFIEIEDAFAIDNDAPMIGDVILDDECVTNGQTVTITFAAEDIFTCCPPAESFGVDSFFDIFVELTFSNETTKRLEVTYDAENEVFTTSYTVLIADSEGPVNVAVNAEDCAGNVGTGDGNFVIDRTAPIVFFANYEPSCIAPLEDLSILFMASDIGCGDISCDKSWIVLTYSNSTTEMFALAEYDEEDESGNCEYIGEVEGEFEFFSLFVTSITIPENAPAGLTSITTYVQDGAGNVGSQTYVNAFNIDNIAPVVENITTVETCYTEGDIITICFDASDIGCGTFDDENLSVFITTTSYYVSDEEYIDEISHYGEYASVDGDIYCFTIEVDGSETFPSGSYSVTVVATDEGGNVTTVTEEDMFQIVHAPIMAEWTVDIDDECGYTNANPICFEVEFDREVFDFTAEDVTVYPGWNFNVSSVENIEGNTWLVCVEALSTSGTGTLYVFVSDGGVYDCAENEYFQNLWEVSAQYDYDAPSGYSAFFSDDDGYEVQYINSLTCDEIYITVEGGEIGASATWKVEEGENVHEGSFIIESDPHIELLLNLCNGTEGEVLLTVTLTDCAGNTGVEATDDVILDVTPPCLTVISAPTHVNGTFDITIGSSEQLATDYLLEIEGIPGESTDNNTAPNKYPSEIFTITPTGGEGTMMIGIDPTLGFTDLAGNPFNFDDEECNPVIEVIYDITLPQFDEISWDVENEDALLYWTEDVVGGSPVELEDLEIEFVQNGGTATDATLVGVIHSSGDDFAILVFDIEGTPNGCEYIIVRPASGSSVFDLAGNAQSELDEIIIGLMNENSATTQASNGSANPVYAVQATLNYTRGDGDKVLVVVFEAGDCVPTPSNGTVYGYSESYGMGDYIYCNSTSGSVVYWGTSSSVVVSGLMPSTSYCAVVYEAMGGDCDSPNYLTPGHVFCFETAPAATQMIITHVNGIPYDKDCEDWVLPSADPFSVTVQLFDDDMNPAYLTDSDDFDLFHDATPGSIANYWWHISEQSRTFTNIQFGIDNGCGNVGNPARDAFFDANCWALYGYFETHPYYDEGPLHFLAAETQQQAFGITFTGVGKNQMTISWSRSNAATSYGEGSVLVMREGLNNQVNIFPQDGETYPVPIGQSSVHFTNDSYNLGNGNRAIYYQLECTCEEGSHPKSVTVTGLKASTTYYARVFEMRYDVNYVNGGGFGQGQEGQDYPEYGCYGWEDRFHEQAIVTNYRHSTGTGNPRNRTTNALDGIFAGLELIGFDGRSFENKVELRWATASEGGSLGFEIYRADIETFEFKKIANVAGNVNGGTYNLLDDDASLQLGKTYVYRLAYISKDGTIEELDEINVTILSMPNSIYSLFVSQVTPNPIGDFGTFSVEMQGQQHLRIEVRNAAGQLVSVLSDEVRSSGVHNFTIELKNRAAGSYNILITTDNEAVYVPFVYVP